jgi:hypothetical protein
MHTYLDRTNVCLVVINDTWNAVVVVVVVNVNTSADSNNNNTAVADDDRIIV